MNWLSGIFLFLGLFLIATSFYPGIYPPARKAIRFRAPKRLTQSQVLQNQLAEQIAPRLDLDPIRRSRTEMLLRNLGHTESPELFLARAMAQSIFVVTLCAPLLLLSVPLGFGSMLLGGFGYYNNQVQSLERELELKKASIERELPQFASTICQSLGTTRDVVAILSSYRRVCGPTLASEIDKTLNDIITGNAETAIHAFEARVASPKLSQVTRGLLAVMRGDNQREYFDILSAEFCKSQDEAVERELLRRPKKLHPYMGILFIFFVLMLIVSLGTDFTQTIKNLW